MLSDPTLRGDIGERLCASESAPSDEEEQYVEFIGTTACDALLDRIDREGATLPRWLRGTVAGQIHFHLARRARGKVRFDRVPASSLAVFHAHLAKAEAHLRDACNAEPTRPEPYTTMIRVAMSRGDSRDMQRDWFDRAVAAQFDYAPAYDALAYALSARWAGSTALLTAFARDVIATERYDTGVPLRGIDALLVACRDESASDQATFWRDARRWGLVQTVLDGYLAAAPRWTGIDPDALRSMYAALAWRADRIDIARRELAAAGANMVEESFRKFGATSASVRRACAESGR